ncbi:MAG: transcriptional repressor [Phycisphaeraceae bacterium]|nr:transcriptional repressor [Phycisphaeraceae bacterium]
MDKTPLGQRRTSQRKALQEVIHDAHGPLTVEELHQRAQGRMPSLGIATVYRTVKLLLDAGEIRSVTLTDGQVRYEAANLGHHHHFRCRKCKAVFDLPGCSMPIPDGTVLPGGFVVEGHEVTMLGLCPTCAAENPSSPARTKRRCGSH